MIYHHNYNEGTLASSIEVSGGTASIPGKDDDRKLFVGGLRRKTTDKDLREHFAKFGSIDSVVIKIDPYGKSRGFGFVVFTDTKSIDTILASGDHYINKKKVGVRRVAIKKMPTKIFVGGLVPEMTDTDIKNFFSQFGAVFAIQSPYDRVKKQRKGFCFVTFESSDTVYELLKTPHLIINGKAVDIRKLKIKPDNWDPNHRFYMMPYNSSFSNHNEYRSHYSYSYDGYARDRDYRYPSSGVANNYADVQSGSSDRNSTSHTTVRGGYKSRSAVRRSQRYKPY